MLQGIYFQFRLIIRKEISMKVVKTIEQVFNRATVLGQVLRVLQSPGRPLVEVHARHLIVVSVENRKTAVTP